MTFFEYISSLTQQCGFRTPPEFINDSFFMLDTGINELPLKRRIYIELKENEADEQFVKFQSEGLPTELLSETDVEYQLETLMWMLHRNSKMLWVNWTMAKYEEKSFFTVVLQLDAGKVNAENFKFAVMAVLGEIYEFFIYLDE